MKKVNHRAIGLSCPILFHGQFNLTTHHRIVIKVYIYTHIKIYNYIIVIYHIK